MGLTFGTVKVSLYAIFRCFLVMIHESEILLGFEKTDKLTADKLTDLTVYPNFYFAYNH